MTQNNPNQLREWLGQVVRTTAQLMEPAGLRVLVPNAEVVPESLARLVLAATTAPNALAYQIWTTLNVGGEALQYLCRSLSASPSVPLLTRAIQEAISNGDLVVRAGKPAGVGQDGTINLEHWITASP